MAKRTAYPTLAAALTLVLSACGQAAAPGAVAAPSSTVAASLSPSLSPSAPPTVDLVILSARIKRAVVPADGLRSLGAGAPHEDGAGKWAVTTQCNSGLPSDPQLLASYMRSWKTSHGIVQRFVHVYSS